jgi:hypothetical protein
MSTTTEELAFTTILDTLTASGLGVRYDAALGCHDVVGDAGELTIWWDGPEATCGNPGWCWRLVERDEDGAMIMESSDGLDTEQELRGLLTVLGAEFE